MRIREHRAWRYGALIAAMTIAVLYARATSTGNPDIDVVEYFHFVEYGAITFLFYRVWSKRRDVTSFALPVPAGLLVGTLDESLQAFIPTRVGELHDVFLNGAAIGCGLLFSIGLDPPERLVALRDRRSRITLAACTALVIAAGALFLHTVHLGY